VGRGEGQERVGSAKGGKSLARIGDGGPQLVERRVSRGPGEERREQVGEGRLLRRRLVEIATVGRRPR